MAIRYLWFDIGYTLLYKEREKAFQKVLAELGHAVPLDRLEREYHLVDKLFMRERPGVFGHDPGTFMPWYLGELTWRLGIRTDLAAAWHRLKEIQNGSEAAWLAFDFVPRALTALKNRSYRLGVISNWDPSARALLTRCGLEGFFEHIVVSSEEGVEKPDPRIWQAGMRKAGVAPDQCLYVGDNYYVDAVGARKAGMECVIINRFGSLGVEEIQGQAFLKDITEVAGWLQKSGS